MNPKKNRHENCDGAPDGGHSQECLNDESFDQEQYDSAYASGVPFSFLSKYFGGIIK